MYEWICYNNIYCRVKILNGTNDNCRNWPMTDPWKSKVKNFNGNLLVGTWHPSAFFERKWNYLWMNQNALFVKYAHTLFWLLVVFSCRPIRAQLIGCHVHSIFIHEYFLQFYLLNRVTKVYLSPRSWYIPVIGQPHYYPTVVGSNCQTSSWLLHLKDLVNI